MCSLADAAGDRRTHRGQARDAVGRGHYLPGNLLPLPLVGVQQKARRIPADHQGQLPHEVGGVLDADVHTLSAGRAVDVGGVATEEDCPLAKSGSNPVVDAKARRPDDLLDYGPGRAWT